MNRREQPTSWVNSPEVIVIKTTPAYPSVPPFHPPARHPEFAFLPAFTPDPDNAVYDAVRATLQLLGGTASNPLGILVRPGDTVVLKPNFIKEHHETRPAEWQQVITHGAVIRAVCDYVLLALQDKGRVIICDAPQSDASFDAICRVSGVKAVVDWYATWARVPVELLDLRAEEWVARNGVIISRRKIAGDPRGYVAVNLGRASEFARVTPRHGFYGADYDTDETRRHHHDDVHEYLLSATVMQADVVINLPKLKTHKKTGITCALKNLVGINGDKNWLPHYMHGSPADGGDQFAERTAQTRSEHALVSRVKKLLFATPPWLNHLVRPIKKCASMILGDTHKVVRSGNWHGNDTTWRMVLDLNKCFFYGEGKGSGYINSPRKASRVQAADPGGRSGSEGEGSGMLDAGCRIGEMGAKEGGSGMLDAGCRIGEMGAKEGGSGMLDAGSSINHRPLTIDHSSSASPPPPRRYLALVDGIIAGEGEGPLAPDAKPCGVLVAGMNPVAVDATCAWLMGFDTGKLKLLTGTAASSTLPLRAFELSEIAVASNQKEWQGRLMDLDPAAAFKFEPHFGWKGAVEKRAE